MHSALENNIAEESKRKINFPVLAKYIGKGGDNFFIVLFTDPKTGTIVVSNMENRSVGDHCKQWEDISNEVCWRILSKNEVVKLWN